MNKIKNNTFFLIYLTGLSIIGFLATDMYLPAFDTMKNDLGTEKSLIGASLTLFLGGYALAQLFWGPLSDKIGKPRVILIGLSIFAIASIAIFFSTNIYTLLIFRLLQAFGVCAGAVSWQALVIEKYPKEQTNRVFATIMPLVALSPALAPLLGVYILQYFGWEYIFIFLAILAIALMFYTLTLGNDTPKQQPKDTQQGYYPILKNTDFLGNVLIYAVCSGTFFAWLTGSPFFLKELGYNEAEIGLSFIPQTIAFLLGGYGYRSISQKVEAKKLMPYLLTTYSLCVIALLALALFTTPTLLTLMIPFCLMALVNGASYPIAVAQALQPFKQNSGKASALQNTIQLGTCFIASAIVSVFSQNALLTTCIVMASTVFFVYLGYKISNKNSTL
ncbi:purine nucleoside transporter PunC [Myroides sp. LJL116]